MKIAVLGAGLVGSAMAVDLAKDDTFQIWVGDRDSAASQRLQKKAAVRTQTADLSDTAAVRKLIQPCDLVINAMPGFLGFQTLKTIIEAGKNVVDIAFFPEDPFQLDALAKEKGVTAIVDCGVAPGMSHVLSAYAASQMDEVEEVLIYVGGLPVERQWPYQYKAVFSPIDVIEEYTRPARLKEHGQIVVKPALSEREYLNFPGIGTLEAFNSDGLRTLLETIPAHTMKEKTLRYPGHCELMEVFRETGFFDQTELNINGVAIRPIDLTAKLLFDKWKLNPGEEDITVMKIQATGKKDGKRLQISYDLYDRYDRATGVHSMARTTGYTATVVARMLLEGKFDQKGVSAPEAIGQKPACVHYLLEGLKERGVVYRETSAV